MKPPASPSGRVLAAALAVIAALLLLGQDRITVFEDEVIILATAGSATAAETVAAYLAADTGLEHPPLFDLLLRGWLVLTDGARAGLRVPSILFFTAGLGLLVVASGRRHGSRTPMLLIGALWPCTPLFAIPCHWGSFAFFVTGGLLEAYTAWLAAGESGRPERGAWVRLTVFGLALVYTSYFGWAVLGLLAVHAVATRGRPALSPMAVSAAILAAAYIPIVPEFLKELTGGTRVGRSLFVMAADAGYHGFALGVSEAVAPWTWPAAAGAAGLLAVLAAAVRTRAVRAELLAFLLLFAAGVAAGILNGKRLVIFAPFWLMLLAGLAQHARPRVLALGGTALAFAAGWFGLVTGSFWGTYRYVEPWDRVVAETLEIARPGDVIVCNHPSFYFGVREALDWDTWELLPTESFARSGFRFTPLETWEEATDGAARVIHVKTAVNPWLVAEQERAAEAFSRTAKTGATHRYVEDSGSALKNRFVGNQPPWRIVVTEWIRTPSGAPGSPDL